MRCNEELTKLSREQEQWPYPNLPTPTPAPVYESGTITMREVGRDNRLQVMMNDDELTAIKDYQFSTRLGSLAEATRELIRLGLAAHRDRANKDSS
jgi:hypothetical protein